VAEETRVLLGDGPSRIEFLDVELDRSGGGTVTVRVTEPGLVAEKRIYIFSETGHPLAPIALFVREMATKWRGWSGDLTYESIEHNLEITAQHDGHVRLNVNLRSDEAAGWRVNTRLTVPPGEALTNAATRFTSLLNEIE
jgi:hypothetical protein